MNNTYKFQRTYTSTKDGHKVGTVVEKDNIFDAETEFHRTLADDMENEDIIEEEVIVWHFDNDGNLTTPLQKKWSRTPIALQTEAE